jgi:CheY-like chemotaxis protein
VSPIDVLVVEDDDDIREMLALVLELADCRVTQASDGRDAMRVLARRELPSLVLLDLMMPNLSGVEVLALIRHDPRLQHLPVVVISGDANARNLALRSGASACLLKPLDAGALVDLTRQLTSQVGDHDLSDRQ